jgi:hypothetical protein
MSKKSLPKALLNVRTTNARATKYIGSVLLYGNVAHSSKGNTNERVPKSIELSPQHVFYVHLHFPPYPALMPPGFVIELRPTFPSPISLLAKEQVVTVH